MRNKPAVRTFISYATRDAVHAELLRSRVQGDGITCFYAPTDIEAREVWRDRLYDEIRKANVVLFLYSDAAAESDFVFEEIRYADQINKETWLIMEREARIAKRFQQFRLQDHYHAFTYTGDQPAAAFDMVRAKIDEEWGRVDPPRRGSLNPDQNPYQGSSPYAANQTDWFFGRKTECHSLCRALESNKERLILVYGPSGAGKTSLIGAGLRGVLDESWWYTAEPISALAEDRDSIGTGLWRRAGQAICNGAPLAPTSAAALSEALNARSVPAHLLWFDHLEHLFAAGNGEQIDYFFRLAEEVLERSPTLRIIMSFREEVLSPVEDRAHRCIDQRLWRKWLLRRLTVDGALECIVRPADRLDIRIDRDLAEVLVQALADVEGVDRDGEKIVTVNPVQLQQVCVRLWKSGPEGSGRIRALDVLHSGRPLPEGAAAFVKTALETYLDDAIQSIAGDGPFQQQRSELIKLALLQFVSEDRRRQQVRAEMVRRSPNGNLSGVRTGPEVLELRRVGRLHPDFVFGLTKKGLIQRTDSGTAGLDVRYELVHDSLAEAIDQYRGQISLLRTLNTLESALKSKWRDGSGLANVFNSDPTLLADLEAVRSEHTGFFDDEKEFLFRCALGDLRNSIRDRKISLLGWAEMFAGSSPSRLHEVLLEALQNANQFVRKDAIALLSEPSVLRHLSEADRTSLGERVLELALEDSPEVQERACIVMPQLLGSSGITHIFALLSAGQRRSQARGAIERIRHTIDCCELRGSDEIAAFRRGWKSTPFLTRLRMLTELWGFRAVQSLGWMAFVTIMSAVFAAVGAGLAYVPMGMLGAALTMGDKGAGWAKGGFHGVAGGVGWGIGIASALLFYWVVLKGGRLVRTRSELMMAIVSACTGGFAGGIVLSLLLAFVFQDKSLFNAGWLMSDSPPDVMIKLGDILVRTRHGWITPLLGTAVGAGIAWELQSIFRSKATEEFVARQHDSIRHPKQALAVIRTIARPVIRKSWRTAIAVSIGGMLLVPVLRPGPGICDVQASSYREKTQTGQAVCPAALSLAPFPARIAGMILIMWCGGVFLQTGFLFGIYSARVGVRLDRDQNFLKAM